MSYKISPSVPDNFFQPLDGLEGPINVGGRAIYYDAQEGQYYDPRTDFYISFNEFEAMCR
jgi:hypothetical protein